LGKAAARGNIDALGNPYSFPNIREIFIPDIGYTWFDLDLDRADLFVVVYEADDKDLKTAMKMGVDTHLLNAFTLMNKEPPPYEELIEKHSEQETCSCRGTCYWERRERYRHERQFAKTFVHGTNYCGKPRTMSSHVGRSVREIERAQRIWFGAHPGIEQWHGRVQREISSRRYVENRFNYRWHIFDRIDAILPEAVAWIPQSTVSICINRIWQRIHRDLKDVQVLLQLHDSIPGQFPTSKAAELLPKIREMSRITIPYDDPLIIPVSIKTSTISWGDC
jgi:DNA polymerase I-like protein with 3'-5' exonuclease and polymerase domains